MSTVPGPVTRTVANIRKTAARLNLTITAPAIHTGYIPSADGFRWTITAPDGDYVHIRFTTAGAIATAKIHNGSNVDYVDGRTPGKADTVIGWLELIATDTAPAAPAAPAGNLPGNLATVLAGSYGTDKNRSREIANRWESAVTPAAPAAPADSTPAAPADSTPAVPARLDDEREPEISPVRTFVTDRTVGATVYIYGADSAVILESDSDGAIVRESDGGETWFEWCDLAPLLVVDTDSEPADSTPAPAAQRRTAPAPAPAANPFAPAGEPTAVQQRSMVVYRAASDTYGRAATVEATYVYAVPIHCTEPEYSNPNGHRYYRIPRDRILVMATDYTTAGNLANAQAREVSATVTGDPELIHVGATAVSHDQVNRLTPLLTAVEIIRREESAGTVRMTPAMRWLIERESAANQVARRAIDALANQDMWPGNH